MKYRLFILFLFISIICCPQAERPKVAVVLSGGSAKGLAHVGVLKVLDEIGLRPDIITGTSMGSIVGGLYSIGYSGQQLDSLVSNLNWDILLSNYISLRDVVMEEKEDFNRYLLEFPIINDKIRLPSGLIEGQKLSQLFSELCWRIIGIESFDHFPIQYRCVASDIINGEIVEFSKGDLPSAMRTSMAIPTVFTPVIVDSNRLCVDGGLMRNFPIPEAIELGADIIIGVYVGFNDKISPEDLYSMTSILTRSSVFNSINDYNTHIDKVDVYIEPDLQGLSGTNFNSSEKMIERGEAAARGKIDELKKIKALQDSFPKRPVKLLPDPELIYIKEIRVKNNVKLTNDFILARSGLKKETWVSKKDMETALDRVYGTYFIDKISYEFSPGPGGFILTLNVKEKPSSFIKTSVRYDNDFGAGLNVNYTTKNIILPNSKFSTTLFISPIPRIQSYYSKYFGYNQGFIISTGGKYEKNSVPLYRNNVRLGEFSHNYFEYFLSTKYTFSPNHLIGIKGAYEYAEIRPGGTIKLVYPEMNFKMYGYGNFSATASYEINFRNDRYYPTWGNYLNINYKKAFSPVVDLQQDETIIIDTGIFNTNLQEYYVMQMKYSNVKKINKRFIMEEEVHIGMASENTVISELFFTGGINNFYRYNCVPLAGYSIMENTLEKFIKFKWEFNFKISEKISFGLITNALKSEDYIEHFITDALKKERNDWYLGYALGLKYKSFLGPIQVLVGDNYDDSYIRWYFSIGHDF